MLLGKVSLVKNLLGIKDLFCVKITDYAFINKNIGSPSCFGVILLRVFLKAYNRPTDE
jgi:hypothetical protein